MGGRAQFRLAQPLPPSCTGLRTSARNACRTSFCSLRHFNACACGSSTSKCLTRSRLTTDGAAYYERCVRILADIDETESSLMGVSKTPPRKVTRRDAGGLGAYPRGAQSLA